MYYSVETRKLILQLSKYKKLLEEKIDHLNKKNKSNLDGALRVSKNGSGKYIYYNYNAVTGEDRYINKKHAEEIAELAQKDYDNKALEKLTKQLEATVKNLECIKENNLIDMFDNMHPARKALVKQVELSDEEFVRRWQAVEYKGKPFKDGEPYLITERGERVRSKSEKMIADKLFQLGIPYRYEYPQVLADGTVIYSDFTLLNVRQRKEYIHEHFGLMDNAAYSENVNLKMNTYINNGILPGRDMLFTMESGRLPLDTNMVVAELRQHDFL